MNDVVVFKKKGFLFSQVVRGHMLGFYFSFEERFQTCQDTRVRSPKRLQRGSMFGRREGWKVKN